MSHWWDEFSATGSCHPNQRRLKGNRFGELFFYFFLDFFYFHPIFCERVLRRHPFVFTSSLLFSLFFFFKKDLLVPPINPTVQNRRIATAKYKTSASSEIFFSFFLNFYRLSHRSSLAFLSFTFVLFCFFFAFRFFLTFVFISSPWVFGCFST